MTAPRYTADQLHAMSGRELDAVVAEVVMDVEAREPKRCHHTGAVHHEESVIRPGVPFYSTAWSWFGVLIERMVELGWNYDVDATAPHLGIDVCFHPKNPAFKATGTAPTLPRAAAIAAVLAVQGAFHV